jgi:hypothetical protein
MRTRNARRFQHMPEIVDVILSQDFCLLSFFCLADDDGKLPSTLLFEPVSSLFPKSCFKGGTPLVQTPRRVADRSW